MPPSPRGLTRRAAVIAVLLVVVGILLAPYLRAFVEQRSQIAALKVEVAERRERVAALEAQRDRWDDPAYVAAQARQRLRFLMPGETGYVVIDPPPEEIEASEDPAGAAAAVPLSTHSWFGNLWESVVVAGEGEPDPLLGPDGGPAAESSVPAP